MKQLVIVESPTKVKTISKYLGKDFVVMSSKGHIIDLPKKDLGVDVAHGFEPEYTVIAGKESTVKELKKAAKTASKIILATDLDREGEAISWHIQQMLHKDARPKVPLNQFQRVVFHEITKKAIQEAFEHPRELNQNLVDAYQARRVLDRIVGYKLSPLLWEKIRYGLSAGRVQSVVVRLIVEREKERKKFKEEPYFNFQAVLKVGPKTDVTAQLYKFEDKTIEKRKTINLFAGEYTYAKTRFIDEKEAQSLQKAFAKHHFVVGTADKKTIHRKAQPPLTTARLQRQAVNRFGFSSKKAMAAAQKLYEAGYITYHRTDSVFLSEDFVKAARTYIQKEYGKDYVPAEPNHYATQSKSAQEAHEAIRPSDVSRDLEHKEIRKLAADQKKMYELIWRNAVASQMTPAKLEQVRIDVYSDASKKDLETKPQCVWRASGSTVLFPGWIAGIGKQMSEVLLPEVSVGMPLDLETINLTDHTTQPPPRYTEASLIKELEKYGIGRPSTYAPTIATVLSRKYVHKQEKYFIPDDTGTVVSDLLAKHFPEIVDLKFTADMEEDLDKIAHGKREWVPVVREFYQPFHALLEKKKKEINKEDVVVLETTDEKCPECGKKLIIKLGRYGKFLSCSNFPDCEYAAPYETDEEGNIVDTPKETFGECPECGGTLILKQGRYGKFIACDNYPKCKYTQTYLDKIGMECPTCKKGGVVRKRTKKGIPFFGCSRYPDCDYSSWKDPRAQESQEDSE